jgi:hypothetical protein
MFSHLRRQPGRPARDLAGIQLADLPARLASVGEVERLMEKGRYSEAYAKALDAMDEPRLLKVDQHRLQTLADEALRALNR